MQDRIKKTAALLQAAALGQEPTLTAVCHIARLIGSERAWLVKSDGLPNSRWGYEAQSVPLEMFDEYEASFATRDVQLQAVIEKYGSSPPPVLVSDEVLPYKNFVRSELFNDLYRRFDAHHMISLGNWNDPSQRVHMRLLCVRGKRDESFGRHEASILNALLPHFDAAAMLFGERRAQSHASLAATFEHAADAVAILDASGRLRYANAAFETLRTELDPHAQWYWATPLESPTFHALKTLFRTVLIEADASSLSARRCHFALAPPPRTAIRRFIAFISTALTSAGVTVRGRHPLFLLVLRESAVVQNERVLALRRQHGLTPMETHVLRRFAEGEDLKTIADRLGVTLHTTRAHMKSLLSKTGCRKQTELVRLLESAHTGKLRLML